MSRIARNSVNGRLNRNTFCSGAEVVPVQCKRGLSHKQSGTIPDPRETASAIVADELRYMNTRLNMYGVIQKGRNGKTAILTPFLFKGLSHSSCYPLLLTYDSDMRPSPSTNLYLYTKYKAHFTRHISNPG